MGENYRKVLYKDYAGLFKNATGVFDHAAAQKWAPCLAYYLRDWLPKDRNAHIIDLGCGEGRVIYLLERMGYMNVEGVDISESQLNIAQQISDRIVQADVLRYLENTTDSYDVILAFDLIEHFQKNEVLTFLERCNERLTPNGRLILQTPNASSLFFGDVRYGDFTHELSFTPRLLSQLTLRAGFLDVETREAGPIASGYSLKSSFRYVFWQLIRMICCLVEMVETGGCGQRIYTRVFLQSAVKK